MGCDDDQSHDANHHVVVDDDADADDENLDRVLPVQQGLGQSIDIRW